MNVINRFVYVVCCLVACGVLGCNNRVPLEGKVVFSDDGSPITSGTICFTDGKQMARGTINPDGTFTMGFLGAADGMPPGRYTVYFFDVSGDNPSGKPTEAATTPFGTPVPEGTPSMTSRRSLIDPKYNRADTSGLTADVSATTKRLDFKVDRAPAAKK
ncbi:MAG: hypothetical protein ACRC46_05490 [Thermoguttaceae bacterium]